MLYLFIILTSSWRSRRDEEMGWFSMHLDQMTAEKWHQKIINYMFININAAYFHWLYGEVAVLGLFRGKLLTQPIFFWAHVLAEDRVSFTTDDARGS